MELPLSVVSRTTCPATVRQGSVVDVWVTPQVFRGEWAPQGEGRARVLTDVVVVAVPRAADSLAPAVHPPGDRRGSRPTAPRTWVRRSAGSLTAGSSSRGRADPVVSRVASRVAVLLAAGGEAWESSALRPLLGTWSGPS